MGEDDREALLEADTVCVAEEELVPDAVVDADEEGERVLEDEELIVIVGVDVEDDDTVEEAVKDADEELLLDGVALEDGLELDVAVPVMVDDEEGDGLAEEVEVVDVD